jgi:hypothetical protein
MAACILPLGPRCSQVRLAVPAQVPHGHPVRQGSRAVGGSGESTIPLTEQHAHRARTVVRDGEIDRAVTVRSASSPANSIDHPFAPMRPPPYALELVSRLDWRIVLECILPRRARVDDALVLLPAPPTDRTGCPGWWPSDRPTDDAMIKGRPDRHSMPW